MAAHRLKGRDSDGVMTSEYMAWMSMRARCRNAKHPEYARYGGRGIRICDRWASFDAFLADMGPKPSRRRSIDRIDNNGGYSPGNCRWATKRTQAENREVTTWITHDGVTKTLSSWSRYLGGNRGLVARRIAKGWSEARAVTTPIKGRAAPTVSQVDYDELKDELSRAEARIVELEAEVATLNDTLLENGEALS